MREVAPKLWIGNALEARSISKVHDAGIEAIVDLAIEEPPISVTRELICCRTPISDASGNSLASLQLAIEAVRHLTSLRVPTLVACSAGMSRSPTIVAAALSRIGSISFNDALGQIARSGPVTCRQHCGVKLQHCSIKLLGEPM